MNVLHYSKCMVGAGIGLLKSSLACGRWPSLPSLELSPWAGLPAGLIGQMPILALFPFCNRETVWGE